MDKSEFLQKETNEYKRDAVRNELKEVQRAIKSLQIRPKTCSDPMEGKKVRKKALIGLLSIVGKL